MTLSHFLNGAEHNRSVNPHVGAAFQFQGLTTVKNKKGESIVMNRGGWMIVADSKGREREAVVTGDPLMDGPIDPHDILKVKGADELQRYLVDEVVDFCRFMRENAKIERDGKVPAGAKRILLGITKASLSTDSFISAATFPSRRLLPPPPGSSQGVSDPTAADPGQALRLTRGRNAGRLSTKERNS